MRLLKILLTALFAAVAVFAGLFIAAVGVVASVVLSFVKRSRVRQHSSHRAPSSQPAAARPTKIRDRDVIDVTATEVPADPENR